MRVTCRLSRVPCTSWQHSTACRLAGQRHERVLGVRLAGGYLKYTIKYRHNTHENDHARVIGRGRTGSGGAHGSGELPLAPPSGTRPGRLAAPSRHPPRRESASRAPTRPSEWARRAPSRPLESRPVGPSRPCVGPTECPLGPKPPRLAPLLCPTRPLFCPTRTLFCPTRALLCICWPFWTSLKHMQLLAPGLGAP